MEKTFSEYQKTWNGPVLQTECEVQGPQQQSPQAVTSHGYPSPYLQVHKTACHCC